MRASEATELWLEYHKSHSKENSVRAYKLILSRFCEDFGSADVKEVTTERILVFLNRITEGKKGKPSVPATPICWLSSTSSKIT